MANNYLTITSHGVYVKIEYNDLSAKRGKKVEYISRRVHWDLTVITVDGTDVVLVEEDFRNEFVVHHPSATGVPENSMAVNTINNATPLNAEDLALKLAELML